MNLNQDVLTRLGVSFVREAHGIAEYKLDANGLKIVLVENHLAPVVTAMVVYRVGSRNEAVGTTGSTHFLEHMMFKSTDRFDHAKRQGIDDVLKPTGADYNATTSEDRTNYYETVPRDHLKLCLAIEADRMRNLRLLESDRNSEMTVVRSEFEIGENDPGELLEKELIALAFREHPYHHPVIGWRSDVENVPLAKLHAFYQTYYWPNNATVIVAGDFQVADALALVAEEFGQIPASPHPIPQVYTTEPPQEGMRRFVLKKVGEDLPRVHIAFHAPQAAHPDWYVLAVIKDLLSGSKSSRLYKTLIVPGIAADVAANNQESRDPGLFSVRGICAPGAKPELFERTVLEQLHILATTPVPADELARVKSANRNSTVVLMDDQQRFAEQLCEGEAVADWLFTVTFDDHYDAVTAQDIMRVAAQYFAEDNLTVGHYIPLAPKEETAEPAAEAETADESETPEPIEGAASTQPAASATTGDGTGQALSTATYLPADDASTVTFASRVQRLQLANGMTILVMPVAGCGVVSVSGKVRAGRYFAGLEHSQVPNLTAAMLTHGSWRFSKDEISDRMLTLGTQLRFSTDTFASSFTASMAKAGFGEFVDVLSDVLMHPSFNEGELAQYKQEYAASLQAQAADPGVVGQIRAKQALYPQSHPFYSKALPEQSLEVQGTVRKTLVEFHLRHYTPANTSLVVVGDIEPAAVEALFNEHLGAWQGAKRDEIVVPSVPMPTAPSRIEVPMADKASVEVMIAVPSSLSRSSSDYYAATLANFALGLDTLASRLGAVVREEHGLTYGIYSRFLGAEFGNGYWTITMSVNPANADKALALVDEVMRDYREHGMTAKELADEAGRAYGMSVVRLRSTEAIAEAIATNEFVGLGVESMDTMVASLKAVTLDTANAALRKYLDTSRAVTVLAGVNG
jgi:zinc protease